jgi:PAS domain S-box-containing protein
MQVSDHLFVGMLEGAPDAMLCMAASGRITLVNAQAERLFGYPRDELLGQPVELLVPEAARAAHAVHRARYLADPRPRAMGAASPFSCRRRDGSTFPAEISLSAIDAPDGVVVMAAVRDVTERLQLLAERERLRGQAERHRLERERLRSQAERDRLERQLQPSQRLESLGELAGGVAHDFNNLLAVISNYAAFVSEEVTKDASQVSWRAVRDDVMQIQRAAGRAAAVTHQLLAFARREVVQLRPLSLNEVVKDVEQLLISTLGEHVVLKTDLAPDLCAVLADPSQIGQVLVNLAVNARDAMPAGGALSITTAIAEIDATHPDSPQVAPGRYACMKVSDTGMGMTKEVIDHAFEPFFTTKPKGEGTGLGLATVYGIVTQVRGHVQVHSEPGLGTTFTILLPASGQDAAPAPAPDEASGGTGETILVVEDEPAMREVIRRILSRNGYHVISAANGREAIEIAASHADPIDLLLTDVVMPQMPGKEAAERIRALRPGMKVLFMSGYTQGLLSSQGVVAPGVNLIEKPFTEKSLLTKLREVIACDQACRDRPG